MATIIEAATAALVTVHFLPRHLCGQRAVEPPAPVHVLTGAPGGLDLDRP
jgi:hypothetical protein